MNEYDFKTVSSLVNINGNFDNTCQLVISKAAEDAVRKKELNIKINQHGGISTISGVRIVINSKSGVIDIHIMYSNSKIVFGENTSGIYDLRLWRDSTIKVGDNTTSNGTMMICDMSEIEIGVDCMFSDQVLIQSADQHGIVDLSLGKIVNNKKKKINIGNHVWLGRKSTLMGEVTIGYGSIIGTGAIVTKNIPKTSIAVGVPAKVVKTKMTWSRSTTQLDLMAKKLIDQQQQLNDFKDFIFKE